MHLAPLVALLEVAHKRLMDSTTSVHFGRTIRSGSGNYSSSGIAPTSKKIDDDSSLDRAIPLFFCDESEFADGARTKALLGLRLGQAFPNRGISRAPSRPLRVGLHGGVVLQPRAPFQSWCILLLGCCPVGNTPPLEGMVELSPTALLPAPRQQCISPDPTHSARLPTSLPEVGY